MIQPRNSISAINVGSPKSRVLPRPPGVVVFNVLYRCSEPVRLLFAPVLPRAGGYPDAGAYTYGERRLDLRIDAPVPART
jgi:hypothetical protein